MAATYVVIYFCMLLALLKVCECYLIKFFRHFITVKDSFETTIVFRRDSSKTFIQLSFGLEVNY